MRILTKQRERHKSDQIKTTSARTITSKPKPDYTRNQSEPKIEIEVDDLVTMSSGSGH